MESVLTGREFGRQVLHVVVGAVVAWLVWSGVLDGLGFLVIVLWGIVLSLACRRWRVPVASFFLDRFEREAVRQSFPGKGLVFFFIGAGLVTQLFSRDVATAAILVLAFGDSVSHVVGRAFGRIPSRVDKEKLLEGTVAGIAVGFVAAWTVVPWVEALVASTAGMVAELAKLGFQDNSLDDNLVVPLVAAVAIALLRLAV